MKNKKVSMYIGIVLLILIIVGIGYLVYINLGTNKEEVNKVLEEYTPQEEITDEQLRQTIVTLYFMDKETQELMAEARKIDAKELLISPYNTLVAMLIEGPKNEALIGIIPEGVILNSAELKGSTIYLDFNEAFINEQKIGKEQEELIISSIVYTLTELTEVNTVIITINGEENQAYPDGGVNFNHAFSRTE